MKPSVLGYTYHLSYPSDCKPTWNVWLNGIIFCQTGGAITKFRKTSKANGHFRGFLLFDEEKTSNTSEISKSSKTLNHEKRWYIHLKRYWSWFAIYFQFVQGMKYLTPSWDFFFNYFLQVVTFRCLHYLSYGILVLFSRESTFNKNWSNWNEIY